MAWNSATFVASWLYAALIGTAAAWILWFGLVRAGEASRVAAYVFFVPLVAVSLGALFLGETLSPLLAVGAAFVVSGIYLVNRQGGGRKKRSSSILELMPVVAGGYQGLLWRKPRRVLQGTTGDLIALLRRKWARELDYRLMKEP